MLIYLLVLSFLVFATSCCGDTANIIAPTRPPTIEATVILLSIRIIVCVCFKPLVLHLPVAGIGLPLLKQEYIGNKFENTNIIDKINVIKLEITSILANFLITDNLAHIKQAKNGHFTARFWS